VQAEKNMVEQVVAINQLIFLKAVKSDIKQISLKKPFIKSSNYYIPNQ
jgi:hypothetical protein